jgi:hypothetical protein
MGAQNKGTAQWSVLKFKKPSSGAQSGAASKAQNVLVRAINGRLDYRATNGSVLSRVTVEAQASREEPMEGVLGREQQFRRE